MQLDTFDIQGFLRDYWQKQPLLIRSPWKAWENPLDGDDLAGLACEEGVEARLVKLAGTDWEAEHGPFPEDRFGALDRAPWTLLVQAVDQHVPQVAALIDPFRFVPSWRIDDVMVSYATDQGGVGPHFDQYDVFLVQGSGRRRWQIGAACDESTPLLPHDHLRLLANFEPVEEWVLEPGDILYLPPRIAHDGVALGDHCMTYSIGFRAPSRAELIEGWCDELLAALPDDDRYTDPHLQAQANPGEISAAAVADLHAMVTEKLDDLPAFARWFGKYSSTRKYPEIDWQPEQPIEGAQLRELLALGTPLVRNPASRFAFIREAPGTVLLFVDGDCFECSGEAEVLAETLCAQDWIVVDQAVLGLDAAIELIAGLVNQGSLGFEE